MWCRSQLRWLIILLFIAGCGNESDFRPASFPKTGAASVRIIGDPIEAGLPLDLCVEGKSICVLAFTPDYWLHLYDRETGELISQALPVGRGPGDAIDVRSMDYDRNNGLLYVHDPNLRKSVRYRFDGDRGAVFFVDEVHHPEDGVIRNYHLLPDGCYLFEGYLSGEDTDTRFFLTESGVLTDQYRDYPGINEEDDKYAFLLSEGKSDPATGRFVFGTLYGAVLECFDLNEGTFKRIGLRLLDPPRIDMSNRNFELAKGTKWGFSTFCLSRDGIFTNYLDNMDARIFTAISVFSWEGKEKARYETGNNILRMAIDPLDENALYGIVSSKEQEFSLARITLNTK